jgi:phosphinothricin acetyltransferase
MTHTIVHASPADIPACLAISNASALEGHANFAIEPETTEAWQAAFATDTPRFPWFVARNGDTVVGFARATPWRSRCGYQHAAEISVYIDPASQGKGLARALYEALLQAVGASDLHCIVAAIALPNPTSIRLHESFGFVKAAVFHEIGRKFDQWWDVGYWELVLDDDESSSG